jgi:hypothetical protein
MGYSTRYSLEIDPPDRVVMAMLRNDIPDAEYALERDGTSSEGRRWYDHEKDLREFSTEYPTHLFTLRGEGEEGGDLWVLYVKNGEFQREKAQITYAPCHL